MANAQVVLYVGVAVLLLTAKAVSSWLQSRSHAQNAKAMGCQPAPKQKYKLPLGLDFVVRLVAWDNDHQLPTFLCNVFKEIGVNTYEQNFLGAKSYVTNDPKNVQAVLATQFQDFELGEVRRGNFGPLLGDGIFTNDGKEW